MLGIFKRKLQNQVKFKPKQSYLCAFLACSACEYALWSEILLGFAADGIFLHRVHVPNSFLLAAHGKRAAMRAETSIRRCALLAAVLLLAASTARAKDDFQNSPEREQSAASARSAGSQQLQQCSAPDEAPDAQQLAKEAAMHAQCTAVPAFVHAATATEHPTRWSSASELRLPFVGTVSNNMLKLMLQAALSTINVSSWLIPLSMANIGKVSVRCPSEGW